MTSTHACPICSTPAYLHDVVDLNKSCEEGRGKFLAKSGKPIYYALCDQCGYCFSPEMCGWSKEQFLADIYNDDYVLVDPDYVDGRPRNFADAAQAYFPQLPNEVRHLDYGGGKGLMSALLQERGWNSSSYDPMVNRDTSVEELGKFQLITAIEVFEHVPDPQQLMRDLNTLLDNDGLLFFSTLLSDGHIQKFRRLDWWYAAPRNGHISLFSQQSLALLASQHGFQFGSFTENLHVFFRSVPPWAAHLFGSE